MTFLRPDNVHDAVRWAGVLSCGLSFLGSLMIISAYWLFPELRKPARRLLLWLSVADLGTAVVYIGNLSACPDCDGCSEISQMLFTIFGMFFPVASFLWTDCIGVYVYAASTGKSWINPSQRLFAVFHLISWCTPLLLGLIIVGVYFQNSCSIHIQFTAHYTGGWCWVDGILMQLIGGKAIELISYGFLCFIYFVTYRRLRRMQKSKMKLISGSYSRRSRPSNSDKEQKINELLTRLTLIPLVFIILRSPGTLRVILVAIQVITANEGMDNMLRVGQAFFDPLQGFCNSVLFLCCVSEVRNTIYQDEINASRIVNHVDLSKMNSEINISYTMTMDVSVDTSSSQYVLHCNLDFDDLSYEEPIFVGLVLVSK